MDAAPVVVLQAVAMTSQLIGYIVVSDVLLLAVLKRCVGKMHNVRVGVVLDAEPEEGIRRTTRRLLFLHRCLEAGPALRHCALVQIEGSTDSVPVDLPQVSDVTCA